MAGRKVMSTRSTQSSSLAGINEAPMIRLSIHRRSSRTLRRGYVDDNVGQTLEIVEGAEDEGLDDSMRKGVSTPHHGDRRLESIESEDSDDDVGAIMEIVEAAEDEGSR
jgi:hypothetical protein